MARRDDPTYPVPGIGQYIAQVGELREDIAHMRAQEEVRAKVFAEDIDEHHDRAARHSDRIRTIERQTTSIERMQDDIAKFVTVVEELQRWRWEVRGAGFVLSSIGGIVSGIIMVLVQWLLS